jgi:hypothetical protein
LPPAHNEAKKHCNRDARTALVIRHSDFVILFPSSMQNFLPAKPWRPLLIAAIAITLCAFTEDKNGMQISVTKVTLSRNDQRGAALNTNIIDRAQGIKVEITSTTFKDAPEGEIEWQILVRKNNSPIIESYSGVEKLKPLRRSDSVELTLGSVPILGMRDGAVLSMDKVEWRIAIKRAGVEIYSATSTPGFATLARRAVPVVVPPPPPAPIAAPAPAPPAAPTVPATPPPPAAPPAK